MSAMNTRAIVITLILASSAANTLAERNKLKPTDFEPLTSLPWKKPDATLESVLDTIFREPNSGVRYAVLAEYLRIIPVAQLGKAFETCIDLNGLQTPDEFVQFFLPIWAERDPKACWKRTKELFRLVGIEDGWLGHDSWKNTDRITVHDLSAIRASRFWIEDRNSLSRFPIGVDRSSLPQKESIRLMKDFTDVWLREFGLWPGYEPVRRNPYCVWSYAFSPNRVIHYFGEKPDSANMSRVIRNITSYGDEAEAEFEVAARRWLQAEPSAAPEILKLVEEKKWPPSEGRMEARPAGPSTEFLMIWAKADLPAIIRWADSRDIRTDDTAAKAKGLLLSRVDAATRDRWLADAKSPEAERDRTGILLREWAAWDPKPALDMAVTMESGDTVFDIVIAAVEGPWGADPRNTSHSGLGFIKEFDPARLPEQVRTNQYLNWEMVMEVWGEVDIGEAARYGLDFLLRTNYTPRENLIKFFSGDDGYTDDAMIDRTFCALRVWAVVKPREMKAWIATIKEADMRKALTWLLEHPWGTGPKE
jgi:hypothetical protein